MPGFRTGAKGSILYLDIGTSSLKFLEAAGTSQGPSVKNLHVEEFPLEIQEKDSLEKEYLAQ